MSEHGLMDDGVTPFVPGVNCGVCGHFVGRGGSISVDYEEMSSVVRSVEGECAMCIGTFARIGERLDAVVAMAKDGKLGRVNDPGWTVLNFRNAIHNLYDEQYRADLVLDAVRQHTDIKPAARSMSGMALYLIAPTTRAKEADDVEA